MLIVAEITLDENPISCEKPAVLLAVTLESAVAQTVSRSDSRAVRVKSEDPEIGGGTMSESLTELEQAVRSLAPNDRARLAEVLLESLQGPPLSDVEAAWNREIEARIIAYDRGDLQAFAAENVFAEARRNTR
jgi:putative addiction module component (TIGR02574 family)